MAMMKDGLFQIGDIVALKSGGGYRMTVVAMTENGKVLCLWVDEEQEFCNQEFEPLLLVNWTGDSTTNPIITRQRKSSQRWSSYRLCRALFLKTSQ
ncbi:MAG: DUF2158 domain-containing protein [Rhizobiales bacterium]|nr:DUF2158 domain-containing protein [Hyphomicrobiales bacterium]